MNNQHTHTHIQNMYRTKTRRVDNVDVHRAYIYGIRTVKTMNEREFAWYEAMRMNCMLPGWWWMHVVTGNGSKTPH